MRFKLIICILLLFILFSNAQPAEFDLSPLDTVYDNKLKTILFYRYKPEEELMPFLTLNVKEILQLSFDILEESPSELYYSFFHFDQNWVPTDLRPEEYYKDFQEQRITEFATSRKTIIPYIHYKLQVPSDGFLVSGNYLICVSDRFKNVLFTRRFFISENKILVSLKVRDPVDAEIYRSHQALELSINTNKIAIQNNEQEMQVHIFQNGDPNTRLVKTKPNSVIGDLFYFNKPDDILFPGKKEFRHKDIRTILSTTQDILFWDEIDHVYHCWLKPDDVRANKLYLSDDDINGRYLILNRDQDQAEVTADYIKAHFTLNKSVPFEEPIYVYGGLTDWQLKPEYQMEYDPSRKAYFAYIWLKMGYYNFMYAAQDAKGLPDTGPLEGDWYETENDYYVLVYYKTLGSRYDRLLFIGEFNSNR